MNIAQRGCGVSVHIQNPTARDPRQPALADLAQGRGVGLRDLERSFPTSSIL